MAVITVAAIYDNSDEKDSRHDKEHEGPGGEPRVCQDGGKGLPHGLPSSQHAELSLHFAARHLRCPVDCTNLLMRTALHLRLGH